MPRRPVKKRFAEKPSKPTTAPTPIPGEVALADTRSSLGSQYKPFPYNPDELTRRKGGLKIYDEMRLDEQCRACLSLKKAAVVGPGWKLEPAAETDSDQALADLLTEDLIKMDGVFEDDLWEVLSALDWGFSVSEKIWVLDEERIHLGAIKARAPHNMDFDQDPYGNINAIQQKQGNLKVDMPLAKFIHFQNNPEFSNPYGTSELRPVYRAWWHKKNILQWWMIFMERFSIPIAKGTSPKLADQQKKQAFLAILKNLQANSSLLVEDGWLAELLESNRDPETFFETALDRSDLAISKGMLLPDKSGLSGGSVRSGSFALAKSQEDLFLLIISLVSKRLEKTVQDQLIRPMALFEAPTMLPPKFRLNPASEEDKAAIIKAWKDMLDGNAVIASGKDATHIRSLLGFPDAEESEAKILDELAQKKLIVVQTPGAPGAPPGRGGPKAPQRANDPNADPTVKGEKKTMTQGPKPAEAARLNAQVPTTFWRALTALERRCDMTEKRRTFEELTPDVSKLLGKASRALVDAVKGDVKKHARAAGGHAALKPRAVSTITIRPAVQNAAKREIAAALRAAYDRAVKEAKAELRRAKAQLREDPETLRFSSGLVGRAATDLFLGRALQVTGVLRQDILADAQQVLLSSVKGDKTDRQVEYELDEALADYLPDEDAQGNVVNVPARLETIARTTVAEAVNEGRMAVFTDPDLEGFVEALTFSAVLDARTTEGCRAWDGVTREIDDPVWFSPDDKHPPDHWNCRSIMVAVTAADTVDLTPDDELPAISPVIGGFK